MRGRRDYLSINGFTDLVASAGPRAIHAGAARDASLASTKKPPASPAAPIVAAIFLLLALVLTGLAGKLDAAPPAPGVLAPATSHGFVSSTHNSPFDHPQRR